MVTGELGFLERFQTRSIPLTCNVDTRLVHVVPRHDGADVFDQTTTFDLVIRQRPYREAHALIRVLQGLSQGLTFRAARLDVTDHSNDTVAFGVFDRVVL
ncbi:hypothetical protein D3C75_946100 [compost metagenome]